MIVSIYNYIISKKWRYIIFPFLKNITVLVSHTHTHTHRQAFRFIDQPPMYPILRQCRPTLRKTDGTKLSAALHSVLP